MQSAHAKSHVVVLHKLKARILHHAFEGFLVGVHTDGLCQILITVGIIGSLFAHFRLSIDWIKVIRLLQQLIHF